MFPVSVFPDYRFIVSPGAQTSLRLFVFYHSSDLPFDPAFLSEIDRTYRLSGLIRYQIPDTPDAILIPGCIYCDEVRIMTGARLVIPDGILGYCRSFARFAERL